MGFSYSKVDCHHTCAYKFFLRYIKKLETKFDERPDNALALGTAMHEGIEKRSYEAAVESYKSHYLTWSEKNDFELYKLKKSLDKALAAIPEGEYEHKLAADDGFIGFIDELHLNEDGTYTMYDYKYSNQVGKYSRSGQLHLYKYYFEKLTGNTIKDMYYVMIPKATRTLKESVDEELTDKEVIFTPVEYDKQQISFFFARKAMMERDINNNKFEKRYSTMCSWCDYKNFCSSKGEDTSELTEESKAKLAEDDKPIVEQISLFGDE